MEESWGDLIQQLLWEMNPQTSYHASPRLFNKFDDTFIDSGSGGRAHGYGHYSADLKNKAQRYAIDKLGEIPVGRLPEGIDNLSIEELKQLKNNLLKKYPNWLQMDVPPGVNEELDNLFALDEYITQKEYHPDLKLNRGKVYTVNTPNKNFVLDLNKPFDEQGKYLQRAIDMMYKSDDIPNEVKNLWKELNRYDESDTKYVYNWLAENFGSKDVGPFASWEQQRFAGSPEASRIFNKYGIKGIKSVGRIDGPVNVTFSGKDIKMANTPLQRVLNRIPKETLGKMVSKAMSTPVGKTIGVGMTIGNEVNPLLMGYTIGELANMYNNRYGTKRDVDYDVYTYNKLKQVPTKITAPQKPRMYWTQGK